MALKTDYQDALFDGRRKYRMIENQDGSYSFNDITTYLQEGDTYGAEEINTTNEAVNTISDFVGKKLAAQTLAAGSTSVTFTDSAIKATSTIEVFTDKWLVSPITITTSAGSCTMTFKAQSSAISVYIIVR